MEIKLLALIVAAALNPLVSRAPQPQGIVPENCEVSDRAPMTRIAAAAVAPDEAAAPLQPVRPATRTAQTAAAAADLEELQQALARNDRPAFDAALARAREAGAPTRVYEDIARIWNAQFEGPFFPQESEAYRIASGYPGYEAAVRRQIFTDATGRKFYPAAESRAFVAQQVGVTTPATRRASGASPSGTSSKRRVEPSPQRRTQTPIATRRSSSSSSSSTPSRSRKTAATRESVPPPRPSPDPSAATSRTAATAAPAPVVPTAVDTSSTEAPPAAGSFDPAVPDIDPAAPDTAVSATAAPTPAPSAAPTVTTPAPPTQPSKGRSIILPAILILIGLGVLILLFRTAR
jgi:hypothetical protein